MKPIDDGFSNIKMSEVFALSNADFNDEIIMSIANNNNAYLVSADRDTIKIPGIKFNRKRKR